MAKKNGLGLIAGATSLSLAMVVLLMVISGASAARPGGMDAVERTAHQRPIGIQPADVSAADAVHASYVFRFDPASQSFETFQIPTDGANPNSVAVLSNPGNVDVWFTEPGADKIGRLVYTSTSSYSFSEYAVTAGSRPLNLVQDGAFVWFTAQKGNYIGRARISDGVINKFTGLTAASRPSGIDVAPNGDIWFTEFDADKLGRLRVTSPSDYTITEYLINATEVGAYGIAVQNDQYVWFGETATGRAKRLKTADGTFIWVNLDVFNEGSFPFDLVYDSGRDYLWTTEPKTDRISQIEVTTLNIGNLFPVPPPKGSPRALTQVANNEFWFTKYDSGQIGRMVYTSTTSFDFDLFDLPVEGLYTADIVADGTGALWIVAFTQHRINMPTLNLNHFVGPSTPFGVQMYGAVNASTGLTEIAEAGAAWIRVPILWSSVEPTNAAPEQYNWNYMDAQVNSMVEAGIEPLLTLGGNPEWAAQYPMGPVYNIADFQEFLGALVERYDGDGHNDAPGSPKVRYWEVYNEPDNANEVGAIEGGYSYFGNRGAEYAALLDAIYPVIKTASPRAQVVFGGIAYDNFEFEGGGFDAEFVDDVLSNCVGPCFDVMNFHYFPAYRARWEPYGKDVIGKTNFLRQKMLTYGFDRPLMCTETAWPEGSVWGSPILQSRYVVAGFVRGLAVDLVVQNWYAWRDVDSSNPGILTNDLEPKPAYFAYQTVARQLDGATYIRAMTVAETGDVDIEGHSFAVPVTGGLERRDVVWFDCPSYINAYGFPADCTGASRPMRVPASAVAVTNLFGISSEVKDGDDGRADGLVTLNITPDPIYIDYSP